MESLKKKELELNEGTRKLENMIKQIETEEVSAKLIYVYLYWIALSKMF